MLCSSAIRPLAARPVERVWGCRELPAGFARFATGAPIGEIWHEDDDRDAPLLVKHLFTGERLSIQVHPDAEAARAAGYPRGKDEAWLVLAAEPGATIGFGVREAVDRDALRRAALDGSIEALIDWRPVRAGDFIYSPAGTIHALGAGLQVIEVQQNLDLTYRLYDYGRPRPLHLEQALAVARRQPVGPQPDARLLRPGRQLLCSGGELVVERWSVRGPTPLRNSETPLLLIPLEAGGRIDEAPVEEGEVWRVDGGVAAMLGGAFDVLVTYPGPHVQIALDAGNPAAAATESDADQSDRTGGASGSAAASRTR